MNLLKKPSAIKGLLLVVMLGMTSLSWAAQVVGTIVQLSGPLLAKKSDGAVKILSLKSEVESGDTLVTQKNTYAMVKFVDNGEITLKPATTMKIDDFAYDAGKPDGDNASFSLVKGGLRSVTGLLGKRNKEKFAMKTPSATIGIRGTTFIAEWIEPTEQALAAREAYNMASTAALDPAAAPVKPLMLAAAPGAPALPPGLYVSVTDGQIVVSNKGGAANFSAGQFGYTASVSQPPVVVPKNPAVQFTPPPAFSSSAPTQTTSTTTKSGSVDCEVR